MTPQEKAKELIDKYKPICGSYWGGNINKQFAKQSALIAVNELLNDCNASNPFEEVRIKYWQEVKKEIEKL
jgi:hypothetical protein